MLSKHYMEKEQREASRSPLNTSCLLYRHVFFRSHQCCVLFFFCSFISTSFLLFIKCTYRSKSVLCYFANDNLPDGFLWGITACLTLRAKKHTRYRRNATDKCFSFSFAIEEQSEREGTTQHLSTERFWVCVCTWKTISEAAADFR